MMMIVSHFIFIFSEKINNKYINFEYLERREELMAIGTTTSEYDLGHYFNENVSLVFPKSDELKKEFLLEYDNFKKPATVEDLQTIATMIHTLLFLVPGTYPDCPDMGIGIQDYMFEVLDDKILTKIRTKIDEQVTKYLPTVYIHNIIVKKFDNDNLRKTIGIGFEVGNIGSSKGTEQFFLTLQEQADSREIISRIIY